MVISLALDNPDTDLGKNYGELQHVKNKHQVLFATEEGWSSLSVKIAGDPHLNNWNDATSQRAESWLVETTVNYTVVCPLYGNGVLDVGKDFQLRIKHWAYMYSLTKSMKWKDRVWEEVLVTSANSTQYFGITGGKWNSR